MACGTRREKEALVDFEFGTQEIRKEGTLAKDHEYIAAILRFLLETFILEFLISKFNLRK